ncbi:hypothetical protein [Haloarchaeobius amylolyticus]|uniref:hypothetical protein n=1 Tax=Haloarchaeobius amylolyticus TaxID=1198296 RepID=UPI00226E64EC|nr:hypothetical protein [Haloarchaeobius amylolyticus]
MMNENSHRNRIAPSNDLSLAAVAGKSALAVAAVLLAVGVVFAALAAVPALALPLGIAVWVALIGGLVALPVFAVQAIGEAL